MLRRALLVLLPGLFAHSAMAQSNDPSFRIVNNTPAAINEIYASPSSQANWGHDRLGTEVVPSGGRRIIRLPQDGNCRYDVRVVFQDGTAEERRDQDTCAVTDLVFGGGTAAPRQAQQGNPSFHLVNQSGRPIQEFNASPASQQSWGPNRLGDNRVPPGTSFPVRLPQGECSYDLRVVWSGGQAQERRGVNTCTMTNYVVR